MPAEFHCPARGCHASFLRPSGLTRHKGVCTKIGIRPARTTEFILPPKESKTQRMVKRVVSPYFTQNATLFH